MFIVWGIFLNFGGLIIRKKIYIMIRVSKQFNFEAAHALLGYDGKCKNIHGHSYKMFVTIKGEPINDPNNVKNGMVLDFGDLKRIVKNNIVDVYDHALIVNKRTDLTGLNFSNEMFERFFVTDYQPTCENMVAKFAEIIQRELPEGIMLFSVRLYETETSFAEWYADDQI